MTRVVALKNIPGLKRGQQSDLDDRLQLHLDAGNVAIISDVIGGTWEQNSDAYYDPEAEARLDDDGAVSLPEWDNRIVEGGVLHSEDQPEDDPED